MTGAIVCAGCSTGAPAPAMPKIGELLGKPNLTSFLDVRFGDSLYRVQNRFPNGSIETAPYGADTYRINDIEVDSIRYQQVKYEFTSYSGMQLVMAWFTPDSSDLVLAKLIAAVGPPSNQKSTKASSAAKTARRARRLRRTAALRRGVGTGRRPAQAGRNRGRSAPQSAVTPRARQRSVRAWKLA